MNRAVQVPIVISAIPRVVSGFRPSFRRMKLTENGSKMLTVRTRQTSKASGGLATADAARQRAATKMMVFRSVFVGALNLAAQSFSTSN